MSKTKTYALKAKGDRTISVNESKLGVNFTLSHGKIKTMELTEQQASYIKLNQKGNLTIKTLEELAKENSEEPKKVQAVRDENDATKDHPLRKLADDENKSTTSGPGTSIDAVVNTGHEETKSQEDVKEEGPGDLEDHVKAETDHDVLVGDETNTVNRPNTPATSASDAEAEGTVQQNVKDSHEDAKDSDAGKDADAEKSSDFDVSEASKRIEKMSKEELEAFTKGDERKTVEKAKKERLEKLKG